MVVGLSAGFESFQCNNTSFPHALTYPLMHNSALSKELKSLVLVMLVKTHTPTRIDTFPSRWFGII